MSPSIKRGILSDNCNANHVSWIGIDLGNFYKKKKVGVTKLRMLRRMCRTSRKKRPTNAYFL